MIIKKKYWKLKVLSKCNSILNLNSYRHEFHDNFTEILDIQSPLAKYDDNEHYEMRWFQMTNVMRFDMKQGGLIMQYLISSTLRLLTRAVRAWPRPRSGVATPAAVTTPSSAPSSVVGRWGSSSAVTGPAHRSKSHE